MKDCWPLHPVGLGLPGMPWGRQLSAKVSSAQGTSEPLFSGVPGLTLWEGVTIPEWELVSDSILSLPLADAVGSGGRQA